MVTAFVGASLLVLSAGGRSDEKQTVELVTKIHEINQLEIKLGQLGSKKGQNSGVRHYGDMLYQDHKRADETILAYARSRHIPFEDASEMGPDAQKEQSDNAALTQRLERASGRDFDREFLTAMEEGHRKAIDMLTAAAPTLEDAKLGQIVNEMLPTLKKHRRMARSLARTAEAKAASSHG
jgi:putative membrane protein